MNVLEQLKIWHAKRFAKTMTTQAFPCEKLVGRQTVKEFANFVKRYKDDLLFLHYYYKHAGENSNDKIINFFLSCEAEIESYRLNSDKIKLDTLINEYQELRKKGKDTNIIKKQINDLKKIIIDSRGQNK